MTNTEFIAASIECQKKYLKIQKYRKLAGKIHLFYLYSLVLPVIAFIVSFLFGFDVITSISFYSIVALSFLYIISIMFFNHKLKELGVEIK